MAEVDEVWEELYRRAPRGELLELRDAEEAHRMGATQDRSDAISAQAGREDGDFFSPFLLSFFLSVRPPPSYKKCFFFQFPFPVRREASVEGRFELVLGERWGCRRPRPERKSRLDLKSPMQSSWYQTRPFRDIGG